MLHQSAAGPCAPESLEASADMNDEAASALAETVSGTHERYAETLATIRKLIPHAK